MLHEIPWRTPHRSDRLAEIGGKYAIFTQLEDAIQEIKLGDLERAAPNAANGVRFYEKSFPAVPEVDTRGRYPRLKVRPMTEEEKKHMWVYNSMERERMSQDPNMVVGVKWYRVEFLSDEEAQRALHEERRKYLQRHIDAARRLRPIRL